VLARASSSLPYPTNRTARESVFRTEGELGDRKNMVMGVAKPGTKDDRAGKAQRQFIRPDQTWTVSSHDSVKVVRQENMVLAPNRAPNQD
jgi:hypothetical protein